MNGNEIYVFGEYVIYDPGYKEPEIGRLIEIVDDTAFVCYGIGCTSSATPVEFIRKATNKEIAECDFKIGYHRFDAHCPNFNPDICYFSCFAGNIKNDA